MDFLTKGTLPPVLVTNDEGKLVGMTGEEGEAVGALLDALPTASPEHKSKVRELLFFLF
jgi:hypothetical protein